QQQCRRRDARRGAPLTDALTPLGEKAPDTGPARDHDPGVDRQRFVEAAGRRGIDVETAAALHEDLYGPGPEQSGVAAIVVSYTPLAAYSFERALGVDFPSHDFDDFYPRVSGGWVFMEIAAIGSRSRRSRATAVRS